MCCNSHAETGMYLLSARVAEQVKVTRFVVLKIAVKSAAE